jgi:hypothetical protein
MQGRAARTQQRRRTAPAVVGEVVRTPGHPLDGEARAGMQQRFGRDFSGVRLHTDARAADSAASVGAAAYTVGNHVVFGAGRYRPDTAAGASLLAHELAHVAQQPPMTGLVPDSLPVEPPGSAAERAADAGGVRVGSPRLSVMRKLEVEEPAQRVPGPGAQPTNAEVVQGYLRELAPEAAPAVAGSGEVRVSEEFCPLGFFARVWRGIRRGFMTGGRIGLYALGVGAIPGALLGGLIGGVMGMFQDDSGLRSAAHPASGGCLCEFINDSRTWGIRIDDTSFHPHPARHNDGSATVYVPSPNGRRWGVATAGGRLEEESPAQVLAHELCGHALVEDLRGEHEPPNAETWRHGPRMAAQENAIRREHGLAPRGWRLRDPYCGESFYREAGEAPGTRHWWPQVEDERDRAVLRAAGSSMADETNLEFCQQMRRQNFGEDVAQRYPVDQAIPESIPVRPPRLDP